MSRRHRSPELEYTPIAMRDLPLAQRPRERLLRYGAGPLSDSELLAILIRTGLGGGRSAIYVGERILKHVNWSLMALAARPIADLRAVEAMGTIKAVTIHAALELGRRAAVESQDAKPCLSCAADVVHYLGIKMRHLEVEELHVLALDTHHRLKRDIVLSSGTVDSLLTHPREVFRSAIAEAASAIILVHNHPSGDPLPSDADIQVTANLAAAGQILGILVLDHVIIGRRGHVSFAEERML